jgi:uncharacterized protein YPO0396
MSLREAAQQAFEAMGKMYAKNMDDFMDCMTAYVNLQRALEEPEQDDTALLRQALEALETFQKISDFTPAQGVHAITALKERLGEKK